MRDLHGFRVTFIAGTLGQGGAERQLYYVLQALQQSGAEPSLLCLTQDEFWEAPIRALGVPVSSAGASSSRASRLLRIIAALRARRPDVVQSQHFYTNLYAALAARALHLPEIGAIRNDTVSEVQANGRLLGTWSLKIPRTLAANSRRGIANAVSLGVPEQRVRFLPNVVDTDHFTPSHRGVGAALHLLAVGRLTKQKRLDRFLRVLACLQAGLSVNVRATIAGAGPLRHALESQASALGLRSPTIEFVGAVADMRDAYQQADILVLTSEWEGTPNVVLEAMASGLSVVATRVGGVPDIIRHGETGMLVDGQDDESVVQDFCRTITALWNDPPARAAMRTKARAFVLEQHSVKSLPGFLSELYGSVVA